MEELKKTNVAVYIDYENIHKTLIKKEENILRLGFFEKIRLWCKNHNKRIVQTLVYCNFDNDDLYHSYHQSMLQNYGVETIHTSNQGKNFADLKITIDVLTSMYSNDNIDEFIIVSNDKDMTPLLNTIRANKRNACVITAGDEYNKTICEFADEHIDFHKICEEKVEHLIINDTEERFYKNLSEHIERKIKEYDSCDSSKKTYNHYELDYSVKHYTEYLKLMSYEILNIINNWKEEKKVVFYSYDYKGTKCKAFIPSNLKQELIDRNILDESDFFDYQNFSEKISAEYKKYNKSIDN